MSRAMLGPSFRREDARGTLVEILNTGSWASLLSGSMKRDAVLGNHYHKSTAVFFFLTRGRARIRTVDVHTGMRDDFVLSADQGVQLVAGESHAICFLEDSEFLMLKSRAHTEADLDTFFHDVGDPA